MLFPQNDRIPIDWFKPTTCMTGPWISVAERLPPEYARGYCSVPVLIVWWEAGEPVMSTGIYIFNSHRWDIIGGEEAPHPVTHWMLLPDPPK